MSLGQIIRNKREELHLTLDDVSAKTGFSKPYLSTIETSKVKNPPSDNLLRKLEQVLDFETGLLQHIAHVERMPADVRQDYEAIDAVLKGMAHETDRSTFNSAEQIIDFILANPDIKTLIRMEDEPWQT